MRKPFICGNWKMNTRSECGVALAKAVAAGIPAGSQVEVGVCPPACYLGAVGSSIAGSAVGLGAQNMLAEADGAFTGEVNSAMLNDLGCRYVILGHSERRQFFGETSEGVAKKTHAALAAGLVPIVCVGETLEEREGNQTEAVVAQQIEGSLAGISAEQLPTVVIAYEPVWAIGTGKVASPEQAEAVHAHIRKLLSDKFGSEAAEQVRIQYGGSVKPGNAAELLGQPNIDGALVGGASLKAEDFLGIIAAA
ncbi:Triosephosphate isomerase [Rosistilla carotiformis]|uniref:Triosephosphate isomerase n=1 Tax=Rosistilla carotiformis TaxID=2528017 RepID=A0A518JSD9_9BACT|nr:triose-phosphate isomerase [Rosistilla carotiformis]QDV68462.1 Triosephosphate isomerase [Rosistilla carotiformis]